MVVPGLGVTVDAEWLTSILRANGFDSHVLAVRAAAVGTGQMSTCFRVLLEGELADGPASVIVKVPTDEETAYGVSGRAYRSEVRFYTQLAERLAVPVPRCFHALVREDGPFVLVLEDAAPAVQGDQILGCSVNEARAALRAIVGLHGPSLGLANLGDLGWVRRDDTPDGAASLKRMLAGFVEQFVTQLGLAPREAELLRRFASCADTWALGAPARRALLHSDYRPDNLLFEATAEVPRVTVVDWQSIAIGHPLRDVAYLLATGVPTEDRRSCDRRLVADYHAALVAAGAAGYDASTCWDDYRYGLFQGLVTSVLGASAAARSERGDRMFTVMVERTTAAIHDHDALELLDG